MASTRAAVTAVGIVVLLILALVAWALIEPHTLAVTRATITDHEVPAGFDGARIVFVSDVHAGRYFGRSRVARLVDRVNALEPDLVILGGDYVEGHSGGADAFYPEVARLIAPSGVFAVMGNHEAWEGADEARSRILEAGITLLENDVVIANRNGAGIYVAGVEDLQTGAPDVSVVATEVLPVGFGILVSHNPDVFARQLPAHEGLFDLALAGHLHGGQVTLFGERALWAPSAYGSRYLEGWREEAGTRILVSRGVGTVGLPIRFFAPPEIHVIELRRGEPAFEAR